jgi:hypothetical protein
VVSDGEKRSAEDGRRGDGGKRLDNAGSKANSKSEYGAGGCIALGCDSVRDSMVPTLRDTSSHAMSHLSPAIIRHPAMATSNPRKPRPLPTLTVNDSGTTSMTEPSPAHESAPPSIDTQQLQHNPDPQQLLGTPNSDARKRELKNTAFYLTRRPHVPVRQQKPRLSDAHALLAIVAKLGAVKCCPVRYVAKSKPSYIP